MTPPAPSPRILFVDDDSNLLAAFQRNLRRSFTFDTVQGGPEAIEKVSKQAIPYAVIVADMRMPLMDGIELLERVRQLSPHTIRVMLTGNADQQTAVDAVNRGHIFRFLNKPCSSELLQEALQSALHEFAAQERERELLEGTLSGAIRLMAEVLGGVAPDALGQGQRLRDSARLLANYVRAPDEWEIELAALLCGLGHAALPPFLLRKLASGVELTESEKEVVKRIPQIGHDLLKNIPRLSGMASIVLYQSKRFDGKGFPEDTVAGKDLPLGARILRILIDRTSLEAEGVVKQAARDAMYADPGAYDPDLLRLSFECFPSYLVQPILADRPVHPIPVAMLTVGQVVVSDIVAHSGLVYIAAGHRLSEMMLARLKAHAELGQVKEPVLVQDPYE